jgi:hypothetical protein
MTCYRDSFSLFSLFFPDLIEDVTSLLQKMPSLLKVRHIFLQVYLTPFSQLCHILEPEVARGLGIGTEAAMVQLNKLPPQY